MVSEKLLMWDKLAKHVERISGISISDLFDVDQSRTDHYSVESCGLCLDFSKQNIDNAVLVDLMALADSVDLPGAFARLIQGDIVNPSENRPALHPMMRASYLGHASHADIDWQPFFSMLNHLADETFRLPTGAGLTDIVHIGIGGSCLGPRLINDALSGYFQSEVRVHFVSSNDVSEIKTVLRSLDPQSTLALIASKSFTTAETMMNAVMIRAWFEENIGRDNLSAHLLAVTANVQRALDFGVSSNNILSFPKGVGGRFSLWSAVSLSVALQLGHENFSALMRGAYDMDCHVQQADGANNMVFMMALLSVWASRCLKWPTQAMVAYDARMALWVPYLQQLCMESLGKRVDLNGNVVDYPTGAIIWGGRGPNSQHSFHQLLMQGPHHVPVDFVVPMQKLPIDELDHSPVWVNALAQAAVMMTGYHCDDPQKNIPGNQPSNMLLLPQLDPYHLGALIALYEHRVYAQSVLLNINAFDQWGVEQGKQMARQLMAGQHDSADLSTQSLIHKIQMHTE